VMEVSLAISSSRVYAQVFGSSLRSMFDCSDEQSIRETMCRVGD